MEYGVQIGFPMPWYFRDIMEQVRQADVTYTFNVLQDEEGNIILVDTGYDNQKKENQMLAEGVNLTNYQSPVTVLKKIGICCGRCEACDFNPCSLGSYGRN